MRAMLLVGFGLLVGLGLVGVGCDDKGTKGAAPGASGSPASGGDAKKTSLTQAQLDEAYKLTDADHADKSVTAVTGKLGAPQKTEGDTSVWYGVGKDGSSCYQLKISKTKGIESGTTDKASCGLK